MNSLRAGAASASRAASGSSTATAHVSRAEEVWSASSSRPAPSWPATRGTAAAASTPPAATSKIALGMVLTVW